MMFEKPAPTPAPLAGWIASFIEELAGRGRMANTLDAYRSDLAQFSIFAGVDSPAAVTEAHVRDWLASRKTKGDGPSSIARKRSAVRNFFAYLIRQGQTEENPADAVKAPTFDRGVTGVVLDRRHVRRLVERAPEGTRDRAVLELLAAGLGTVEITALALGDVDFENGRATIRGRMTPKHRDSGDSRRTIDLPTPACEAVRKYLAVERRELNRGGKNAHHVFLNYAGRKLSRQAVWDIVGTYAKQANMGAIGPSDLRRAAIVGMIRDGLDLADVQHIAGHTCPWITRRYVTLAKNTASKTATA